MMNEVSTKALDALEIPKEFKREAVGAEGVVQVAEDLGKEVIEAK